MEWKAISGGAALLLTISTTSVGADPAGVQPPAVVIRVFDQTGMPTVDLLTAMSETEAILDRVGLSVSWANCSERRNEAAACQRPLGENELVMRLLNARSRPGGHEFPLGYSLVQPAAGHGSLATVYEDLVRSAASRARVDRRRLLGRAIAHEIGHLLLNTNHHASAGLMRAVWSHAEIRHDNSSDWRFGEDEARMMRASLASAAR
jgi:hypothetical protein